MIDFKYVNIDVEKVKNAIKEAKCSDSEVSTVLGYSPTYMSGVYNKGRMNAEAYNTMCDLIGRSYAELSVDDPENLYQVGQAVRSGNGKDSEMTSIWGHKLKKFLKKQGFKQKELSAQLGYTSYDYIASCTKKDKMNDEIYTKLCKIIGQPRSQFIKYTYNNPIVDKVRTLNRSKDIVEVNPKVLNDMIKKTDKKFSVTTFSAEQGKGKDYLGKILRNEHNKISLAFLEALCNELNLDINKIRVMNTEEIQNEPTTDINIDQPISTESLDMDIEKPVAPIVPSTPSYSANPGYSKLILAGANGEVQEKILVDKKVFDDLTSQLNSMLNLMDSAFNQINQLQAKISEITGNPV